MVMLATKGDNRILSFGLAHVRLALVCIAILVVGVGFFTALPAKESYQAVAVGEIAKQPKKLYTMAFNPTLFTNSEETPGDIGLQQPSEPVVAPPSPPVPAPAPKVTSAPESTPTSESSRATTPTPAPDIAAPPAPAPVPAPYVPPEPEPTTAPAPEPETAPAYGSEPVAEEPTTVPSDPTYTEPTYSEPVPSEEPATSTPSTPEERNSPPAKGEDPSSGSCKPPACTIRVEGEGNSITPKPEPR
jgi:hypothetical protein